MLVGMVTGRFNIAYKEDMDMFMAQIERDAGNIVLQTYFPMTCYNYYITITILKNSLFRCSAVLETLGRLPSNNGEYSIEDPRPALQALLLVSREQEKSLLTSVIFQDFI